MAVRKRRAKMLSSFLLMDADSRGAAAGNTVSKNRRVRGPPRGNCARRYSLEKENARRQRETKTMWLPGRERIREDKKKEMNTDKDTK